MLLCKWKKAVPPVEFPAVQDNELLSCFQTGAVFDFLDGEWFPLKGNREMTRDFPRGNRKF